MCRNRWQRIRDGAKYGVRSHNRCGTCGEMKRGHTCQAQGCQLRAAEMSVPHRPPNGAMGGEGQIYNAMPHVEPARKRAHSTMVGGDVPVGVTMPSGVPLLTVDVNVATGRGDLDVARFSSPDSFRLLANPPAGGGPAISVPAWAVPVSSELAAAPAPTAPAVAHSESSAALASRLSGPSSDFVPPMPMPSRSFAHSFDLTNLLAPGSPVPDERLQIDVPLDSAPASPAPPMLKGIPSFGSIGGLLA